MRKCPAVSLTSGCQSRNRGADTVLHKSALVSVADSSKVMVNGPLSPFPQRMYALLRPPPTARVWLRDILSLRAQTRTRAVPGGGDSDATLLAVVLAVFIQNTDIQKLHLTGCFLKIIFEGQGRGRAQARKMLNE